MAGHSHAKNVMHQKAGSDAKKAKVFNKIAREVLVSCKTGSPDPSTNPRLRAAIIAARKANMPRDRVDRAIKAAQPGSADSANYDEVRYEAYGPGGCALIIEALTDNRNRTASELRTALSKLGGSLAESNSVSFMFTRLGEIIYPASVGSADAILEAVIDAGGDNVESGDEVHEITTSVDEFGAVRNALEKKLGEAQSSKLVFRPQSQVPIQGDAAQDLLKLLDILEDDDDVQTVTGNFELSEADIAAFNV